MFVTIMGLFSHHLRIDNIVWYCAHLRTCVSSIICLDQNEFKQELLAAKRKKLREEYKAMMKFVEEDKRIRKTERREIADKVIQ